MLNTIFALVSALKILHASVQMFNDDLRLGLLFLYSLCFY
jgi:hypothetical protein